MENEAIKFVKNNLNHVFAYNGNDKEWIHQTGYLEILEDMNCCAPTHNILFAFVCDTKRKVMTAKEFMTFIKDLK